MTDQAEWAWLLERADNERTAHVVLGLANGEPYYEIGEAAGYSPGNYRDENQKRKNLSAAISRAARTEKVQNLLVEFLEYRRNGTTQVADSEEVLRTLTSIARSATGQSRLTALRLLSDYHRAREGNGDSFMRETSARRLIDESLRRDNTWLHGVALAYVRELLLWGDREMKDWRPPERFERAYALLDVWGGAWIDVAEVMHASGAATLKEYSKGAGTRSDDRAATTDQPERSRRADGSDSIEQRAASNAR